MKERPCPCCSKKNYENCCKPFHKGVLPKNALELMRSRYAAYALNLPEYIVQTTHPLNPQYLENKFLWKKSISQFSKSTLFENLEILAFEEQEKEATVIFKASLKQTQKDASFTEKSFFKKEGLKWLYFKGEMQELPTK